MEGKWTERGKMDSEGYTGLVSDTPTDFCLLSLLPGVDGSTGRRSKNYLGNLLHGVQDY